MMTEEIQKVLKMSKEGTITDEQAARLIEELTKKQQPPKSAEGIGDAISNLIDRTLDGAFARGNLEENSLHMSKVDSPRGESFVYKGNQIRMSHLKPLNLNRAEFVGNQIDASKVEDVSVIDGKFSDCSLQASAISNLKIERSTVVGSKLLSCKIDRVVVEGESSLEGVKWSGCAITKVGISQGSQWRNCVISGAKIKDFESVDSRVSEFEAQAALIAGTSFEGSQLHSVFLRGTYLEKTRFTGCKLSDVLFTGKEGMGWKNWKKNGFTNVRVENSEMTKVLFSDCRWKNVVVKNVSLNDVKVQGIHLSGVTLDGNDEFLKAIGAAKKATA